mmetsp:Transcript_48067/g.112339  ORF Transcript_48067/g.112339 Transcript_48067/m.112339 type:complete len:400 (-) Transcript_48067:91-1290(-)
MTWAVEAPIKVATGDSWNSAGVESAYSSSSQRLSQQEGVEEETPAEEEDEEEDAHGDNGDEPMEESSDSTQPPRLPEVVADGRFRVKRRIGSGSYSEVFLGTDTLTLEKVAIKAEWKGAEKTDKLHGEASLYQKLGRCDAVPSIRWYGAEGEYRLLVMDLLGPSLDSLLKDHKKFSLRTTLLLADQMIERLEAVHERGIVYRDIKPHNFLFGRGESQNQIFMVDFGLSKRYWYSKQGRHVTLRKHVGFVGTVRYCSLRSHQGYEASRRDDLEALGYVLLHFLRGTLPWQGLKAKNKRRKHAMMEQRKLETIDSELCRGYPQEFSDYLMYCRGLGFEERPDYAKLRRQFKSLYIDRGFDKTGWLIDWDETSAVKPDPGLEKRSPPETEDRSRSGERRKGR